MNPTELPTITVEITFSETYNEYRVPHYNSHEDSAYYTEDFEDACLTAHAMWKPYKINPVKAEL